LTHGWSATNSIVHFSLGSSVFGLTVLHAFFDPLQLCLPTTAIFTDSKGLSRGRMYRVFLLHTALLVSSRSQEVERSAYPGTELCRQYWKQRRERARRPLPICTVSLKLRFLHSQMVHGRRLRKNIIGRLLTSLIQEEHAQAETTILDDILLADQF
jgi:hypothetical protein